MKFRKKPVVVDAFRLGKDYIPDWFFDGDRVSIHCPGNAFNVIGFLTADIETLEGTMHADYGDYIIKGVNGELYPCKPNIFEKTYEPVED